MNFDAELTFKFYKIQSVFSSLLWYSRLGFQNVVIFRKPTIKMWSSLGDQWNNRIENCWWRLKIFGIDNLGEFRQYIPMLYFNLLAFFVANGDWSWAACFLFSLYNVIIFSSGQTGWMNCDNIYPWWSTVKLPKWHTPAQQISIWWVDFSCIRNNFARTGFPPLLVS